MDLSLLLKTRGPQNICLQGQIPLATMSDKIHQDPTIAKSGVSQMETLSQAVTSHDACGEHH